MPIYEYFCPDCSFKFELLRQHTQADGSACCPRCHRDAARVLSSFASFTKDSEGQSVRIGAGSACATCSATSCDSCRT
ncbi:MAG: FmdB family zinc ribbon protein [Dehalococcoidia bacterium]